MHAAILGVAVSLLGIKTGCEVAPDGSVTYVIQLDAGDLERFRVERTVESDLPSNLKNVRRYRIEFGTLPLRQDPLPKEDSPPRAVVPPLEKGDRTATRHSRAQSMLASSTDAKPPDFLVRPEDKKTVKTKEPAATPGAGKAAKPDDRGEAQPEGSGSPYLWTSLVVAALLAGNVYFGWMMWETRRRYRGLVLRQRKREREPRTARGDLDDAGPSESR